MRKKEKGKEGSPGRRKEGQRGKRYARAGLIEEKWRVMGKRPGDAVSLASRKGCQGQT